MERWCHNQDGAEWYLTWLLLIHFDLSSTLQQYFSHHFVCLLWIDADSMCLLSLLSYILISCICVLNAGFIIVFRSDNHDVEASSCIHRNTFVSTDDTAADTLRKLLQGYNFYWQLEHHISVDVSWNNCTGEGLGGDHCTSCELFTGSLPFISNSAKSRVLIFPWRLLFISP